MSDKKQVKSIVQRVNDLERSFLEFMTQIQQGLSNIDQRLAEARELGLVLTECIGKEQVVALLKERQAKRDRDEADRQAAAVQAMLEQGALVRGEEIKSTTLIVGQDIGPDGQALGAGRVQVRFEEVRPDFKEALLGKKVGDIVPVIFKDQDTGHKFEVLELYESVAPPTETSSVSKSEPPESTTTEPQSPDKET